MKTESKEEIINSIKKYMYDESIETSKNKTKIIAQPYFISVIKKAYENNYETEEQNNKGKETTSVEQKNANLENNNYNIEDDSETNKKNKENVVDKTNIINERTENEIANDKVKNKYVLIAGDFDKLNELNEKHGFEEGSKSMQNALEKIIKVLEADLNEKQNLIACRIGRRRIRILNRRNRAQPTKRRKNPKQNKPDTKRTIKKRRKHTQTKNDPKLRILR